MLHSASQRMIRKSFICQVGVSGIACFLSCTFLSAEIIRTGNMVNTKNTTVRGMDFKVSLPMTSKAGLPIEMKGTLANKGQTAPAYGEFGGFVQCCRAEVRDAKGNMVSHTEYGNNMFSIEGFILRGQYGYSTLKPGASRSWSCDLNKCYKLKAGNDKLSLTVVMDQFEDKRFPITIKDIPFKVE